MFVGEYALKTNGSQRVKVISSLNGKITYQFGDRTKTEPKRKFKQKYMWVKGGRI